MKKFLQPTAIAVLLLAGGGFASAYAPDATLTMQSPAPTGLANGADKPIVLAQVPDVEVQFGGDRNRDRDGDARRRKRDEGIVIVPPRLDRELTGERRERDRDRDHERSDRDRE